MILKLNSIQSAGTITTDIPRCAIFKDEHSIKIENSCMPYNVGRSRHESFPDFSGIPDFSGLLYFTRNEWISVPAFCRALNFENRTSITDPIFKIQRSTEGWD